MLGLIDVLAKDPWLKEKRNPNRIGRRVGKKGSGRITLTLESDRAGFESHVVTAMFLPLTKFLNHSLFFFLFISEIG